MLDTIGELAQLYQVATVVFVGGSLVDHGGHNILEPAVFGKPIVFGPHMQNFKEIADAFVGQRRGGPGAVRARAGGRAAGAAHRSGAPRPARRRGPRAGRGEPRRQGQDARRHCRAAAAGRRVVRPPDAAVTSAPLPQLVHLIAADPERALYGAAAAWRGGGTRAIRRASAGWPAGDQRRQPERRRQREDAGRRAHRAPARSRAASGRPSSSRGYGRRVAADGVTVVSDGAASLRRSTTAGDEPLMLARALPGVPVLVGADRYLSGRVAERRLGATRSPARRWVPAPASWRATSTCWWPPRTICSDRVLPAGRLREPLARRGGRRCRAVDAGYETAAERIGRALRRAAGVPHGAHARSSARSPRARDRWSCRRATGLRRRRHRPAGAFLRRPARRPAGGWPARCVFRDHHLFTKPTSRAIAAAARAAGATLVLTTEKDAVRLAGWTLGGLPSRRCR